MLSFAVINAHHLSETKAYEPSLGVDSKVADTPKKDEYGSKVATSFDKD